MRPRDLLLVGAVLLIGGFAAADALRGEAEAPVPTPTARASSEPEPETVDAVETIRSAGPDVLVGRLVFSDEACLVRELDLASGELAAFAPVQSTCSIIGAQGPRDGGPRVAVALPSPRRDVLPYRVLDLARTDPHVLGFRAQTRSVVWDSDGSRVGWCDENGRGQEVELGGDPRPLSDCPAAYTASGARIYVRGRRVLSETTPILHAPGEVEALSFAPDGSVAIAAGGTMLVLYGRLEDGSLVEERRVSLPAGLRHLRTLFSPTHCHAALLSGEFPPSPAVFVVDLRRCPGSLAPATFSGRSAAWSPFGRWLAAAERNRVVVHPLFENEPAVVLAQTATDLAWRP
jgi:hypothetical protein